MKKLIVGLGNPGRKYRLTRHNVGFLVVRRLAKRNRIPIKKGGPASLLGKGVIGKKRVIVALPLTYMNLVGPTVKTLLEKNKINLQDLLIICDDLNIDLGMVRIKSKGSNGGHKGLRSIIDSLESLNFPRLRVGIGPHKKRDDLAEYVLSPFNKNQRTLIKEGIDKAVDTVELWLREGIRVAMNRFNRRS